VDDAGGGGSKKAAAEMVKHMPLGDVSIPLAQLQAELNIGMSWY
jgi:hypothetical protein